MTPSSSVPRVTGRAIDALPSRTCPANVSSVSPGGIPATSRSMTSATLRPSSSSSSPARRSTVRAVDVKNQPHSATIRPSIGSTTSPSASRIADDSEPGEEQPDEPADARRGPQTGPRIAGPRPGQAADHPAAVEREGRDQVEQAQREVECADDERDVTDDQGRSLVVDPASDARDPEQGQADAEADERTGRRDGDLVTRTGRRELGRRRGAEEVDDDRVGRDAPTAGYRRVPELVGHRRHEEQDRDHDPDPPPDDHRRAGVERGRSGRRRSRRGWPG